MKRPSIFVPLFVFSILCGAWPAVAGNDGKAADKGKTAAGDTGKTTADKGKTAADKDKPAADKADDKRPLTVLAELADKDASVRGDMAKRISRFLMEGDGGKASYVAAEARKGDLAQRIAALPKAWVDKKFKGSDADKLSVVQLYYVLGEDQAPKWAAASPDLKDGFPGFKREQLVSDMKPWTGEGEALAAQNPGVKAGQLAKGDGDVVDWVNRFLDTAAGYSKAIIESGSISKEMKRGAIEGHEEASPVQGSFGTRRRGASASAGYDGDDLFKGGAFGGLFFQEGDTSSREISVKMVSYNTPNGVENQIAVCDISYPEDRFCRRFPINRQGGTQTFPLDDRKPGQKQYTLKFETDETGVHVVFGRPKAVEAGDGSMGTVIRHSLQEFAVNRAQHVLEMNRVVVINGVEFLVAGQTGGFTGEHLYYRKDQLMSDKEVDLKPEFVAEVVTLKGQNTVVATHKVKLGKVNGKDYHTYWDPIERKFKIGDGPGVDAPGAGTGTTNPGTGTTNPGTGTTNPGQGGEVSVEDQFINLGYYTYNIDVNKAVKPGLLRVLDITEAGRKWLATHQDPAVRARPWTQYHVMLIPGVNMRGLPLDFMADNQGAWVEETPPLVVIQGGRYLLMKSDHGRKYLGLNEKPDEKIGFPAVGRVQFKDGVKSIMMGDGKDMDLVKLLISDVLKEADVAPALKNLAEVTKGRKLKNLHGSATSLVAEFDDKPTTVMFWPKIESAPETGGSFPDATGKGETIFVNAPGGPEDEFKDNVEVGPADKLEKLSVYNGLKKKHAVLYVNDVEKGKGTKDAPRNWYIQFNFKVLDKQYRSQFIPLPINEGGQGVAFPYEAKPAVDINENGITVLTEAQAKLDLMKTGTHGRLVQPTQTPKDKGVYAVFATGAKGDAVQNKKENCLGPLLWWGMDKKAAQEACEKDSY